MRNYRRKLVFSVGQVVRLINCGSLLNSSLSGKLGIVSRVDYKTDSIDIHFSRDGRVIITRVDNTNYDMSFYEPVDEKTAARFLAAKALGVDID